MTTVVIELAGSPRGKGRPRHTRAGITYTPAATRSYEAFLAWTAAAAMKGAKPLEGPLTLTVEAYMPIPTSWSGKRQRMAAAGDIRPATRPDVDNIMKSLDGLNGIVWRDDAQVVDVRCVKLYSERPRLVISVASVGATAGMAGISAPVRAHARGRSMTAGPGTRRFARRGTYCGAWARSRARPCHAWPMKGGVRCRLHGGFGISGPKTAQGKAGIAEVQRKAWADWRSSMGLPPEWRSNANQVCRAKRRRLGLTAAAYIERHGPHRPEDKEQPE